MEVQKMGPIFLLAVACLLNSCIGAEDPDANLLITRASREVDLSSAVVKQSITFSFENTGTSPISSFHYVVESSIAKHLAYISAETKGASKNTPMLDVKPTQLKSKPDLAAYKVTFSSALGSQDTTTVIVRTVFTHVITPYPKEISQMEKQLVQYTTSAYINTPYKCTTQNSDFNLPSSNIESYSRVNPVSKDEANINYGPYSDLPPFSKARITLHYENNGPFISVASLDRLIQVSHWGVIQVEEQIHVKHTGAVLKGSFSRYDFQRNPNSGASSVKSYKSMLPAAAQDVYYRDEIGNISTSHLREDEEFTELTLRPRFPLFGGWQTRYYIGYNLPSYEYLYNSGSHFLLKMRLVDHVFDNQVIDEVTTRIILPEGSKNIVINTPYKVEQDDISRHYTYLDVTGRPVVTVHGNNLVEDHIADFELQYDFESYLLLQEPLLLVGGLLLFFCTIIFLVRLDFTISKDDGSSFQSHAKDLVSRTTTKQFSLIDKIQSAIDNYKKNRDVKKFKFTTSDHMSMYDDLYKHLLREFDSKDSNRSKILKMVKEIQESMGRLITLAEQLVNTNIKGDAYVKQSEDIKKKVSNLQHEVKNLIQRL